INVLGLLNPQCEFNSFIVQGTVNSEVVIACLDGFSQRLSNSTYIVLDNAAQHTSREFKYKIKQWKERGLFLYYLPPYSP
ncbi:MAG: transposase, partial [Burkholderiales bacterium]